MVIKHYFIGMCKIVTTDSANDKHFRRFSWDMDAISSMAYLQKRCCHLKGINQMLLILGHCLTSPHIVKADNWLVESLPLPEY